MGGGGSGSQFTRKIIVFFTLNTEFYFWFYENICMVTTFHKCHEDNDASITVHEEHFKSRLTLLHLIMNHRDQMSFHEEILLQITKMKINTTCAPISHSKQTQKRIIICLLGLQVQTVLVVFFTFASINRSSSIC